MTIKVRFAPSPTGNIHLGNIRAAALNYFLASKLNGQFILRIDNTDTKRGKEEYITNIKADLKWLGYIWHEEFRQSNRIDRYNQILQLLEENGYVYKCYETEEELERKKSLQLAKKMPPIYDRASLKLTQLEINKLNQQGIQPYYRFKINYEEINWLDLIKGNINFKGNNLSDPVIIREDKTFLYILTSVIDDVDKEISHIIRGEDHIANTAVQIQMFKAVCKVLNIPVKLPQFAHFSLVVDENGVPFSKRDGSMSIASLKEQGILPLAINISLLNLGLPENNTVNYNNLNELTKTFDITKYSKSTVQLSLTKLKHLNLQLLQQQPFNIIQTMCVELLKIDITEPFWHKIKHNITEFTDIKLWYNIVNQQPVINNFSNTINLEIIKIALQFLPKEPWHEGTWNIWLNKITEHCNVSKKEIFVSLRLALTGLTSGMEFKNLILLLGYELTNSRLQHIINNAT